MYRNLFTYLLTWGNFTIHIVYEQQYVNFMFLFKMKRRSGVETHNSHASREALRITV